MNENLPAPRRYSDREVRRLLERATELQYTEGESPEATGMTLPQLEAIAREAGIDVDAVRRAAAELDSDVGGATGRLAARLAGAPLAVVLQRVLPDEVSSENFEVVIPLIRAAAGTQGQASQVGHTFSWQAQNPTSARELGVFITSRNGETRIRIEERYGALAGAVFGGGLGGIGGGVGIGVGVGVGAALGSVAMMIGFPIAVIGVTYLGSRALFNTVVGRRRRVLGRLMEEIVEAVASGSADLEQLEPGPDA
jgi:hypothetical protein